MARKEEEEGRDMYLLLLEVVMMGEEGETEGGIISSWEGGEGGEGRRKDEQAAGTCVVL